jgi:hypothetical protein
MTRNLIIKTHHAPPRPRHTPPSRVHALSYRATTRTGFSSTRGA